MSHTETKIVLRQLGAKIAYFRTLAGISQSELAKRINSTQSTVSKIECGAYNDSLSIPMLVSIANALNVDLSLLLHFNDFEKEMWDRTITASEI